MHDTNDALGENNILHFNTHSSDTCYNNNSLNHSFITNNSNDLPLSLHPVGMMLVYSIQNRPSCQPLKVLFDPGSDLTFIHQHVLPQGTNGKTVPPRQIKTLHGVKAINQMVVIKDISFPEFSPTQRVDKALQAYVYDQTNSP